MNISTQNADLKKTYIAIITMLLAILCVDMYMVVIKFLGDEYTVIQLAVFRNIAGVIPLFILILFTKEYLSVFKNLSNKFLVLSFFRGLGFLSMNIFIFISVINLEFATAMVLTFSSPFFIVILSIIFLKDKVGIYRWSAIFIGFFGVVLIMQPTSDIFNYYSIFPILTAIAWAFTVIILKFIPQGHSTAKIQLYTLIFNVTGAVILFLITTGHTEIKSTQDFLLMILTGILGGTAAILFIYAYRLISASKMASFEYFGIPSSFVLGWLFFNEAPWEQLFPGVFVIVFAGMIIIWRDKVKQKSTKVSREIN
ncbi:DMT family transporter [Pelagibacterales bacterium SAG-MED17]|jgi:drug/metabolite transporter (DMT)-like permease|nr:DMT family transporter [Pelagibacterales bacterium SAG-MED17]|tara:strand:- start:175 stop:1107 length:933 start_codon:yes stop_codon:yes gene_type:complete